MLINLGFHTRLVENLRLPAKDMDSDWNIPRYRKRAEESGTHFVYVLKS